MSTSFPDLTQRPPRSPRTRLGGYAILPRMLDKGRASLHGKNGEYHYDCPLDKHILNFLGIEASQLLEQLKAGKGDGEILSWIQQNQKNPHQPWEIETWSKFHDQRGPDSDKETLGFFSGAVAKLAPEREDIRTWFDLLDVDDFVSFGGKA